MTRACMMWHTSMRRASRWLVDGVFQCSELELGAVMAASTMWRAPTNPAQPSPMRLSAVGFRISGYIVAAGVAVCTPWLVRECDQIAAALRCQDPPEAQCLLAAALSILGPGRCAMPASCRVPSIPRRSHAGLAGMMCIRCCVCCMHTLLFC